MQQSYELPQASPTPAAPAVPAAPAPCPDCGAGLTRQSGCLVCVQCGWAKCA